MRNSVMSRSDKIHQSEYPSTLPRASRGIAAEPHVSRPGARLNFFNQGATVADLEKDSITWNLEPLPDWVIPDRCDLQRRRGPDGMGNELWEDNDHAILNLRREAKELAPHGIRKVWPSTPQGPPNGHAFDSP